MNGTIASMTGFARREGGDGTVSWVWEIKSVNGRNLDVRCRVPNGYEALEATVRANVQKYCNRGNIQVFLAVDRSATPRQLRLNRALLDQLLSLVADVAGNVKAAPPRLDGLLALPGVVETVDEKDSAAQFNARAAAMDADLTSALTALTDVRRREGQHLEQAVTDHLTRIDGLIAAAASSDAARPEALRERLRQQVDELLNLSPGLPPERLAQEAAILIAKADVREELDRLRAHLAAARDALSEGGAVGRRLDFLCQELNREANTLCAKSWDVSLTRLGLELKTSIDQLREQVQNIE